MKSDFLFWLLNEYYPFKYYIFTGDYKDIQIGDNYLSKLELNNNELIVHFNSYDLQHFFFNYNDFSEDFKGEITSLFLKNFGNEYQFLYTEGEKDDEEILKQKLLKQRELVTNPYNKQYVLNKNCSEDILNLVK